MGWSWNNIEQSLAWSLHRLSILDLNLQWTLTNVTVIDLVGWQKWGVSGAYQGRIRSVSGAYQGRIRGVSGGTEEVSYIYSYIYIYTHIIYVIVH